MINLWTLGGLSTQDLLHRTVRESWQDDVFGQAGRMAFYHFLALFPSLLVFLAVSARVPHLGSHVKTQLQDLSNQVLPAQVSGLVQTMMGELSDRGLSGWQLLYICAGTIWAAFNGTWAMIYGLNRAYEVEDRRSWRKLIVTVAGLSFSLLVTGSIAVFVIFFGSELQAYLMPGAIALRVLEWLVLLAALCLSFAIVYRFGPNLQDREWRWSTPGALCALILWIACTLGARFYFEDVNNYSRSYGHLNSVVMLLLWLYLTNAAILIGGEMNSEIEKAAEGRPDEPERAAHPQDSPAPGKS